MAPNTRRGGFPIRHFVNIVILVAQKTTGHMQTFYISMTALLSDMSFSVLEVNERYEG